MGLIGDEVTELRRLCWNRIPGSKVITCTPDLVRVQISKTPMKTLTASFRFPPDYPTTPLLIQLKSKYLGDHFIDRLATLCEEHTKQSLGKPQCMSVLEFVQKFIEDHPLCACSEEISTIKNDLLKTRPSDTVKLNQNTSTVILKLKEGEYVHKVYLTVPDNYPDSQVKLCTKDSDFPDLFQRFFQGHGAEIARRCVEPPLNKKKLSPATPFTPKPSLLHVAKFLVENVHGLITEKCSKCGLICFPENPEDAVKDEENDLHVERVYCGHLYHLKCFLDYMKTPPFVGGKKCHVCTKTIYHEKYKVSAQLSESRWAHQQARDRELEDIADFLA